MAFDSYDDYEQSELIQKWLRQNGVSIIVGIALGLALIFGYQQWKNHGARHQAEAADVYGAAQVALAGNKTTAANVAIDRLQKEFPETAYAVFAVSERARTEAEAGQFDKAEASLAWAQDKAGDEALKALVQLRFAQVRLAQGKASEAISSLDALPKNTYLALSQELRGDALVKLGRPDDARKAYRAAIAGMDDSAPQRGVVQMKLDDLAVAGKQGA